MCISQSGIQDHEWQKFWAHLSLSSLTTDWLQVDAASLQQRNDGLASANQQFAEDAVGNKASYDTQTAVYNKLQVSQPAMGTATMPQAQHQSIPVLLLFKNAHVWCTAGSVT